MQEAGCRAETRSGASFQTSDNQLLYHGRAGARFVRPVNCWIKFPSCRRKKDLYGEERARILLVMGRESFEALVRNVA
jgi:hypothetical protein